MPPKKGTKRAATAQEPKASSSAEKRSRTDTKPKTQEEPKKRGPKPKTQAKAPAADNPKPETESKFQPVIDAINQSTDLSDSCRQLLLTTLPFSLGTPRDERHETQHECVKMVGEVVEGVAASLQTAIDKKHVQLEELAKSKSNLLTKQKAAEDLAMMAAAAEHEKKHAVEEAARLLAAAKVVLRERQDAQRHGDSALGEAETQKVVLSQAMEVPLQAIVQEELESAAAEDHYNALKPAIRLLPLDDTLTAAVPAACKRPKSQRVVFDNMAIEQLENACAAKLSELTRFLDDAAAGKQQRAEAVRAANAEMEGAKARNQKLAEEFEALQAAFKKAKADVSNAKAEVQWCEAQQVKVGNLIEAKHGELERFRQHNIGTFECLRNAVATPVAASPADEPVGDSVASGDAWKRVVQEPIMDRTAADGIVAAEPVAKTDVILQEKRTEAPVKAGGA